jgi:Fanconi anemia group M protein
MSPTKPLCAQHLRSFRKFINIDENQIRLFTGSIPPNQRKSKWKKVKIAIATPQTAEHDVIAGFLDLKDYTMLVVDEAHRASGNYSYCFLARQYMRLAKNPLILALTASPGSAKEKIDEIKKNLFIEAVEIRTEEDKDVRPYVKPLRMEWREIDFPKEFKEIKKLLEDTMRKRLRTLKELEIIESADLRKLKKRDLLQLQGKIRGELAESQSKTLFIGISLVAACLKIYHGIELLETQGISPLYHYFERLEAQRSKAVASLFKDPLFKRAVMQTQILYEQGVEHPKFNELEKILKEQFEKEAESLVIVFSQYRDTIDRMVTRLEGMRGIRPVRFVGQSSLTSKGLTQKRQIEILESFREKEYNVLCSSSVAEEGLDLPAVNLVVFFEGIPSELRTIQRKGRTARLKAGKVIVLMCKGTRDVAYYWSAHYKEKRMKKMLKEMQRGKEQRKLFEFG